MGAGVRAGVGPPDELYVEPLRTAKVERSGILALLLARDDDSGPADSAPQSGPLADAERDMVDPPERLALLRILETEDLVPEEQLRMVGAVPDDVHAELLDEESLRLGPVADPDRYMIEPDQAEVPGGWMVGHGRATFVARYSRSPCPSRDPGGQRSRRNTNLWA